MGCLNILYGVSPFRFAKIFASLPLAHRSKCTIDKLLTRANTYGPINQNKALSFLRGENFSILRMRMYQKRVVANSDNFFLFGKGISNEFGN